MHHRKLRVYHVSAVVVAGPTRSHRVLPTFQVRAPDPRSAQEHVGWVVGSGASDPARLEWSAGVCDDQGAIYRFAHTGRIEVRGDTEL